MKIDELQKLVEDIRSNHVVLTQKFHKLHDENQMLIEALEHYADYSYPYNDEGEILPNLAQQALTKAKDKPDG